MFLALRSKQQIMETDLYTYIHLSFIVELARTQKNRYIFLALELLHVKETKFSRLFLRLFHLFIYTIHTYMPYLLAVHK